MTLQTRIIVDTRQAYNQWSEQYDSNENKTRDLEAIAPRTCLSDISFEKCLEIGCGTGKNTSWFAEKARQVTAVDLSEEMLAKARQKLSADHVEFRQGDLLSAWNFGSGIFDLVSFSLVLEHIENLEHVFREAARSLATGGHVYLGELHPFKQYTGSKARFETEQGIHVVDCFNHHISDFTTAARKHGLLLKDVNEYFDNDDRQLLPRILTLLFTKI